jgi:hypothetical protein
VCQETRSWWARAETEVSKRCRPSAAHVTVLAVSSARGQANSCSSVNAVLGRSGSGHRQTRLARSSRTGRPKHGCHGAGRSAAMPDRDDAAVRTATDSLCCLHAQNQAGPGRCDRADVDTFHIKKGVGPLAPPGQEVALGIAGSLCYLEAWSLPIQSCT